MDRNPKIASEKKSVKELKKPSSDYSWDSQLESIFRQDTDNESSLMNPSLDTIELIENIPIREPDLHLFDR